MDNHTCDHVVFEAECSLLSPAEVRETRQKGSYKNPGIRTQFLASGSDVWGSHTQTGGTTSRSSQFSASGQAAHTAQSHDTRTRIPPTICRGLEEDPSTEPIAGQPAVWTLTHGHYGSIQ